MAMQILRLPCVVLYLSQEQFPASALALLACCSKECHEVYKGVLDHRRRFSISPKWVAYVLWSDIQPRPGVSVASLRRLQRAMSLTREELIEIYLSQDNFFDVSQGRRKAYLGGSRHADLFGAFREGYAFSKFV